MSISLSLYVTLELVQKESSAVTMCSLLKVLINKSVTEMLPLQSTQRQTGARSGKLTKSK